MKSFAPTRFLLLASLAWSPSLAGAAEGLAYARYEGGYWQVNCGDAEGRAAKTLTSSPLDKRCLRPGREPGQLLCRDNEGRLFSLSVTRAAEPTPVLANVEVIKDYDFHPTRGYLISTYAPNSKDNIRIWWYGADERQKKLLVSGAHLNEMPRWQPDGAGFVFVQSNQGRSRIFRCPWDSLSPPPAHNPNPTPNPQPLFGSASVSSAAPAPSPDGQWLAFCREGATGMDLWLAKADGAEARLLYAGPGLEADPAWDAASQRICFSTWDGHNFRVAWISRSGGQPTYVTPAGGDCRYPLWLTVNESKNP